MASVPDFVNGRCLENRGTGMVMTQTPILLTIRETAALLRVSNSTIERMLRCGDLPRVKMNYATRILRRDVDAYIDPRSTCRIDTLDTPVRAQHEPASPGPGPGDTDAVPGQGRRLARLRPDGLACRRPCRPQAHPAQDPP